MDKDEKLKKLEILIEREYLVVKANELVQKSRFELSLLEQKTVAYICSLIKPSFVNKGVYNLHFQLDYEFDIKEYCKVCGIDYNAGKNYADIKAVLKKLRDRSMWLTLPDGSESTVAWLNKVNVSKRSGIVKIRIDEDLAPYLFNLGKRFTQYQLSNILAMRSAFAIRIYELMKSYSFQAVKIFDINELKHILMVDNIKSYSRYPDFRRKVLEQAQKEINELSDIDMSFEPITKGRKVVKIKFSIKEKDEVSKVTVNTKVNNILDKRCNS